MTSMGPRRIRSALMAATILGAAPAHAWDLAGTKVVSLVARDGSTVDIGTVRFVPEGAGYRFSLTLEPQRFKDYFLSMKEFKCLEGQGEIHCHVPYPYPNPSIATESNLHWLEHALLFLYKSPKDFGAKLWNGIYYRMEIADDGIRGVAQAVDLNLIGAPPANPSEPPYTAAERSDVDPDSRWFGRLTIR